MSNKSTPLTRYEMIGLIKMYSHNLNQQHEDMMLSDAYSDLKDKHVAVKLELVNMRREMRDYRDKYLSLLSRINEENHIETVSEKL